MLNAREPPPAVFWFLLHRCKRNSPAGETSFYAAFSNTNRRADGADFPYQGKMSRRDKRGRDHRPLRKGVAPVKRADGIIRPHGGVETCAGDRKGRPYGVEWQYAVNGGPVWDRPLHKGIRAISYYS